MEGRISATGLKSVELDELTTNQIIINNEGLQYYHNYNILLPTVTEGYYNLQEELDNIMISNTTQDLELIQLQSGLSSAQASITTLGVLAGTANTNALAAINLANQKSWILFFQKPLRCDISNNIYLDFDTNYFNIDASNNLTLNNLWKKDVSNNLYFTSGKVGIGLTNPNYNLDVLGNINCGEIYRNGTPISSTLSLFLPLTGGTLSGILTGTTISATNMSASLFSGSGASLTNINASNISSGTLSVSQGGIGTTSLSSNQILIGNGTSILQSANLTWNNTSNTLSVSNLQMTGQITGVTTLNGTTGLFGKLQTTNNTNVGNPSVGVAGGTGDKLILFNGASTVHPCSLGINTNTLWYSVPTGASHKFYVNGTNITTIANTGLTTSGRFTIGDATYQLLIDAPTSTTASSIQTIQQGVGYNQNLTLQALNGKVGIGTTNPNNILQVGDGARLRISNGVSDYSLIGTKDVDDATNTRIVISGNTRSSNPGCIEHVATSGSHIFYTNGSERMRINNAGLLTTTGNIDCSGGIALTGSNAFAWEADIVDAGNKTNTYINFRNAGASSDWCYLRQIGISNTYKLALDFHDDGNDARFCIRNVQSAGVTTDIITEVFTVDNGNVSCTGTLTTTGKINLNGDNLQFPNTLNQYKINLYGTNSYGFGITGGTLMYSSATYHKFYNSGNNVNTFTIDNVGNASCSGSFTATGNITATGNMYAANFGIGIPFTPNCRLDVQGVANIRGTSAYSVPNSKMYSGSLTIGSTDTNYGNSTGWTGNTAGLMMECADVTEIVVHDSGTRLASLLYYYGPTNQIYIGRDKGWGVSSVFIGGYLQCLFYTVDYVGYDKVGVADTTGTGRNESRQMYQIWNSFTDFHRCFIDDELFNKDNPQEFKDIYMGRIVVSTGTIKTHSSKIKTGEQSEWEIKIGKEAITIEDAHPMIELSRKKRDKRVLGVLGLNTRKNSHPERLIVNAIGEGGIWVCNSNGIIENGDYITSSDYLGYGEKQDDDLLHNYTVAKATMDCNFELDSNLYICLELESGIKIAFIAVTYHCG